MDTHPGIPQFLEELIERLDAHVELADRTAEAAALKQELQARCSPPAWGVFMKLEEAFQQRERVLFKEVVEFFLLTDDWEGPPLD